jgi:hypothetical protein
MDEGRQGEQGPVQHAEERSRKGHGPNSPAEKYLVKHIDRNRVLEPTGALACPSRWAWIPWANSTLGNMYGASTGSY